MDAETRLDSQAQRAGGFDRLLGLELIECSGELASARAVVRDALRQPGGAIHGGVYASIADSLATSGTMAAAAAQQSVVAAVLSTQTSLLHPISAGTIHALATPKHRGRTTSVWEVEITDDAGRLCALARVTVGVREG